MSTAKARQPEGGVVRTTLTGIDLRSLDIAGVTIDPAQATAVATAYGATVE